MEKEALKGHLRNQTCSNCTARARFPEERQHGKWCHLRIKRPRDNYCKHWQKPTTVFSNLMPVYPMAKPSNKTYHIVPIMNKDTILSSGALNT